MHQYQRLQDLIIKVPDYHGKHQVDIKSVNVRVNYNVAIKQKKRLIFVMYLLYLWTGSFPEVLKARHSIAAFGLRKGMPIGAGLTLHKKRMVNFIKTLKLSLANLEPEKLNFKLAKTGPAFLGIKNFYDLSPLALSLLEYRFLHSNKKFGLSISINFNHKILHDQTKQLSLRYILSQYSIPTLQSK